MKKLFLSIALIGALHGHSSALTITLDAETLKDVLGSAMPISGIVVLTAATTGQFFGPTPESFVSGTEILLDRWDLSAFATPGVISDLTDDLRFVGDWGTGDPLRIYWYPTLTASSMEPGAGTSYGSYRDPLGTLDGGAAWVTPSESDTISLRFYTSDATVLTTGGSNGPNAGVASLTVTPVPEPTSAALCTTALIAASVMRRRSNRRG